MDTHERTIATLERQPVDQTPVDIWLKPEVLQSLREHTGIKDEVELSS